MSSVVHKLKTLPEYFELSWKRKKTYEVRKLDRPFHVGDKVLLEEYSPDFGYFGRAIMGNIVNIFVDPEYVKSGMGILQLDNMQNGYRGVSE